MKMFLDSAKTDEIRQAIDLWDVDGVTTNPRHVKDSGKPFRTVIAEIAELFAGTDKAISMPAGAIVVGGWAKIVAAFDSSVTLDIGDGDDDDRYIKNDASGTFPAIDALEEQTINNVVMLCPTGYKYTAPDTIDVKLGGAANTTGILEIVVLYIIDGRANEVEVDYS